MPVEPSVSSFPPSVSDQLAEKTPNYIPKTAQGAAVIADYQPPCDEVEIPSLADANPAPYPKPGVPITCDYDAVKPFFDGVVKPNLQILLAMVLGDIDASIPNKDQNKAVKNLVRRQFDEQMLEIQRMWVQISHYGTTDQYLLKPDPS